MSTLDADVILEAQEFEQELRAQMNVQRGVILQRLADQLERGSDDALERDEPRSQMNDQRSVILQRPAKQIETGAVEEIAALIRNLTYGDMIALAEGLWSARPEGADILKDNLPSLLYRWSTCH